jgi:hypothetical protein
MNMKEQTGKIIRNATVIYTDNTTEQLEALHPIQKGTVIGRIIDSKFIGYGFIPKSNIKEIKPIFKK